MAIGTTGGNPVIVRATDGVYLLYFLCQPIDGPSPECDGGAQAVVCLANCIVTGNLNINVTWCGLNLASSRSLSGPWDIRYNIVKARPQKWDACALTNPAPFEFVRSCRGLTYRSFRREEW